MSKNGKLMMRKKTVAYDQKVTFILRHELYWGLSSEIQEGQQLSSAVLNSGSFFEQNLEGVTVAAVGLYGNARGGYQFMIESQK